MEIHGKKEMAGGETGHDNYEFQVFTPIFLSLKEDEDW